MSTYNGWPVIAIPAYPPAPQSIEFFQVDSVSLSRSPFTGQQQVQIWGGTWMEATVTMPPMSDANAQAWITFLRALQGSGNVFQFSGAFAAAFPASISTGSSPSGGRYWRLANNKRSWSISLGSIYGFKFDIIEAF